LDELAKWADIRSPLPSGEGPPYLAAQRKRFSSITCSKIIPDYARRYSASLCPSIIPSAGPLISSLIASGVARYGGYRLLERVGLYDGAEGIKNVPGSKEDIFKSKEMGLVAKRRLMRFLMFASRDFEGQKEIQGKEDVSFLTFLQDVFSLDMKTAEAITYALAFCTAPTGIPRLHTTVVGSLADCIE